MKRKLLFFILGTLITIGVFAQTWSVPVTNPSFSDPAFTGKISTGLGIPGWQFDGTVSDAGRENKGTGPHYGDSLIAYVHSADPKMYQVVEKITGIASYTLNYMGRADWTNNQSAIMRSYFGVKNGGAITLLDSVDNALIASTWKRNIIHTYTFPANTSHIGDSLIIGFNIRNADGSGSWGNIDSVKLTKTVISGYLPVINPSFTDPTFTGKISNGSVPGWPFDGTVSDAGRENKGTGPHYGDSLIAYVHSADPKMYQVIGAIGTGTGTYTLGYMGRADWTNNQAAVMRTYFGAKKGGAITLIDSVDNPLIASTWKRNIKHTYTIPVNSSHAGDSLIIGFNIRNADGSGSWGDIDSVSLFYNSVPKGLDSLNVTFANSNDSLEVLKSGACTAIAYPADAANTKVFWSSSDTTLAKITTAGMLTAVDSLKTGIVYAKAISQANSAKKDSLKITIFRRKATAITITGIDSVDIGANILLTPNFTPATTTFQNVIWSVSNGNATVNSFGLVTGVAMGTVTVTATSKYDPTISGSLLIKVTQYNVYVPSPGLVNGDFELPANKWKYVTIGLDSVPGWHSDDLTPESNGRELQGYNSIMSGYSKNLGLPMFQVVDTVSVLPAKYLVSYNARQIYNSTSGDSLFASIKLSHYTPGTDRKLRTVIDSVETDITNSGWKLISAAFSIPALPKGDSLVMEIKLKTYSSGTRVIDPANNNSWIGWDNVAMFKLTPVIFPTSIALTFDLAGDSVKIGSVGNVSAVFTPSNSSIQDVIWSVSNTGIATIDANGALTGLAKGVVTVTGAAKNKPSIKGVKNIKVYKTSGVGVTDLMAGEVNVYPNPSDGNFILNAPVVSEISIFDVTGKLIYSTKTTMDKTPVSLSGSGIYLLKIKTKEGDVLNKKVLVK